ncbi:MAG: methyltransferase domain-containing protein [Anaerolineae bacterium]|nr:methyltransferase domain-containing protein [Anaerolineae bacterium]
MRSDFTGHPPSRRILKHYFPEIGAGGFTSLDGTIEFYTRINALIRSEDIVLDFGAGRGAALSESRSDYKRALMRLSGKVAKVVGVDIDKAVIDNPGLDEVAVVRANEPLPFADASFDMIVSDFVFEHVTDPKSVAAELRRILKPGGWICARTPNKYCLVSLATRLIRNSSHKGLLRRVQPERKSIDIFPTAFRLNSIRDVRTHFPQMFFEDYTYRYEAEPSYFFNSRLVFVVMLLINRLSPPLLRSNLFVFLRKI